MIRQILFYTILLFVSTINLNAQDTEGNQDYLIVKGTIKIDRVPLEGAKAKVLEDGKHTKTYNTDKSGKFEAHLSLNKKCDIIISKQGFYSKSLSIDTHTPPEDVGIWSYRFAMGLIREIEGFDASVLDDPIGKIMFVDDFGDFDYDEEYTLLMQKRIKAMMKEYNKMLKEAYEKIIIQADEAYGNEDYDLAEELYDKAIDLDPYETYPDDQISMIRKIRQQDKNAEKNYAKNLAQADEYYQNKDYTNAKIYYNRALKYKAKEQYPKDQIAWIEDYLLNKSSDEDLIAEQNKLYAEAISEGERSFNIKQYELALNKYTEASGIKPNEQLPKDKISEINLIIAQLANDKANSAERDKEYLAAISVADASFNSKNYDVALVNYKKAITIKPEETYPRSRVTEIENLLAANKTVNDKYNGFIALADAAFNEKDYKSAQNDYNEALNIKANEPYPKEKLAQIDALLLLAANNKKGAFEAEYNKIIAQGDAAFNNEEYNGAKGFYNQALLMKDNEAYPQQKIIEIDGILADMANKKRAYDLAISRADNEFNVENWEKAKVEYEEALGLFPNEQYPQTRLNEIENKLIALKGANEQLIAREKAYQRSVNQADSLYDLTKYNASKNSYNQALAIKSNEQYPQDRIKAIDKILAQQDLLNKQYDKYIASADQFFIAQNYQEAKGDFIRASELKPEEAYPKEKLAEISKLLMALQVAQKAQGERDAMYNDMIQQADLQYNSKEWQAAMDLYKQASSIKVDEAYPKQRIGEIASMLAGLAEKDKLYNEAISTADELFENKSFTEALAFYNKALAVKSNEAYPKAQIEAVNVALAALHQKELQYKNYIKIADVAFTNNELSKAKVQYQAALGLKANEVYPSNRIIEIDRLLLEQQGMLAAQEKLDAQYKALVDSGDELFALKNYEQAKGQYEQALFLKENEAYPKGKIGEINGLLQNLAAAQKAYDQKIIEADNLFQQNNLNGALSAFQQAAQLKPSEEYPKEKIAVIGSLLADQLKKQKEYEQLIGKADELFASKTIKEAKSYYQQAQVVLPNESYPKQRIAEIDALLIEAGRLLAEQESINKQYNGLIAEGDKLFGLKDYEQAKGLFSQAMFLKENEIYPKNKVSEINSILESQAAETKTYNAKIAEADGLFQQNNYNGALSAFQQAAQIKPNEEYPKEKIILIGSLLADQLKKQKEYEQLIGKADELFASRTIEEAKGYYQQAQAILPNENYPKLRIAEIDALILEGQRLLAEQESVNKQYNALIAEGDKLFGLKDYEQAKGIFSQAMFLKENETYPKNKVSEINGILETQAGENKAYNAKIAEADALFQQNNLNGALSSFNQASQIKPGESYPKQKVAAITTLIAEKERKQAEYNKLIANADQMFSQSKFAEAKPLYQNALLINNVEQYPKDQLIKVDRFLAEEAQKNANLKALLASYNAKVKEADALFAQQNYEASMSNYMDAKSIKSDENYPDEQIAKINGILKENQRKLDANFAQAIKEGDQFSANKSYAEARAKYENAQGLKPNDPLPKSKIAALERLLENERLAQANQAQQDETYNKYVLQADNAFKAMEYTTAIAFYKSAQGIKPAEKYPKDRITLCEVKIKEQNRLAAEEAERKKQAELAAAASSFSKDGFDYAGEKRDANFLNELGRKYPEGITVENYNKPNKKIKRVIVNKGGIAKEYIEVKYSYGTFYFRNGQNISRTIFYTETKK